MQIVISDRDNAVGKVRDFSPTHLVSFTTHDFPRERELVPPENYLKLDISKEVMATEDSLKPLIGFYGKLDQESRLFIVCDFGVTRSATAALLAMCVCDSKTPPRLHYMHMRKIWPRIVPQRGMIRVSDQLLGLGGELERLMFEDTRERIEARPAIEITPGGTPRTVKLTSKSSKVRRALKSSLLSIARRI